jgi:hypothetical protein
MHFQPCRQHQKPHPDSSCPKKLRSKKLIYPPSVVAAESDVFTATIRWAVIRVIAADK